MYCGPTVRTACFPSNQRSVFEAGQPAQQRHITPAGSLPSCSRWSTYRPPGGQIPATRSPGPTSASSTSGPQVVHRYITQALKLTVQNIHWEVRTQAGWPTGEGDLRAGRPSLQDGTIVKITIRKVAEIAVWSIVSTRMLYF